MRAALNECQNSSSLCLNGATCIDYDVGYQCLCTNEFTGEDCSQSRLIIINLSFALNEFLF